MPQLTADDAVRGVLAGDQEAYRTLVAIGEPGVRAVVAALLPERAQVDRCVAEILIAAYRKLGDWRPGTDFRAWLEGTALRLGLEQRRTWLRHEGQRRGYRAELEGALDDEIASRAAGARVSVAALGEGLARLDGQARELIEAHYWRGVAAPELARTHERSDAWVRVTLFRAREALTTALRAAGAPGGR